MSGFEDFCGDGCWWYEEQDSPGCPEWGELLGKTAASEMEANEACCHCGGGTTTYSEPDPTSSPVEQTTTTPNSTEAPTAFATDQDCVDLAEFKDYFGDDCKVCALLLRFVS